MTQPSSEQHETALAAWFRELLRGPVQQYGDYFDRLGGRVESSAPVCTSC